MNEKMLVFAVSLVLVASLLLSVAGMRINASLQERRVWC